MLTRTHKHAPETLPFSVYEEECGNPKCRVSFKVSRGFRHAPKPVVINVCSHCRSVRYCSIECQRTHRSVHILVCEQWRQDMLVYANVRSGIYALYRVVFGGGWNWECLRQLSGCPYTGTYEITIMTSDMDSMLSDPVDFVKNSNTQPRRFVPFGTEKYFEFIEHLNPLFDPYDSRSFIAKCAMCRADCVAFVVVDDDNGAAGIVTFPVPHPDNLGLCIVHDEKQIDCATPLIVGSSEPVLDEEGKPKCTLTDVCSDVHFTWCHNKGCKAYSLTKRQHKITLKSNEGEYSRILKACARCRKATYCTSKCQLVDWRKGHKGTCVKRDESLD